MLVLPFKLADEVYCIGIDMIKEIVPVVEFRTLPDTEAYICGLINYRGGICPVVDLSVMVKKIPAKLYLSTRIIIISVQNPGNKENETIFGVLAEQVTETMYVNDSEIHAIPAQLSKSSLIQNTIIKNGNIIQMIDPEKIFFEKLTIFQGVNTIYQ